MPSLGRSREALDTETDGSQPTAPPRVKSGSSNNSNNSNGSNNSRPTTAISNK